MGPPARVDACGGDLVTLEQVEAGQLAAEQAARGRQALNALHTALSELQGLVPGHYVLKHEVPRTLQQGRFLINCSVYRTNDVVVFWRLFVVSSIVLYLSTSLK